MMKLIFEHKEALLWYDEKNRILKASWFGDVGLEAISGVLTNGSKIIQEIDNVTLIFDRTQFNNFTAESRIWFKQDFMKSGGVGRRLIRKVRKIAAIKTNSPLGQITTTVFSKILSFFNPYMDYRTFDNMEDAKMWVNTEITHHSIEPKTRIGGFFSRLSA